MSVGLNTYDELPAAKIAEIYASFLE